MFALFTKCKKHDLNIGNKIINFSSALTYLRLDDGNAPAGIVTFLKRVFDTFGIPGPKSTHIDNFQQVLSKRVRYLFPLLIPKNRFLRNCILIAIRAHSSKQFLN